MLIVRSRYLSAPETTRSSLASCGVPPRKNADESVREREGGRRRGGEGREEGEGGGEGDGVEKRWDEER